MKHTLLFSLAISLVLSLNAQVKIGDNPNNIDDGSLLELESNNSALVLPRMSTTDMMGIPTPLDGSILYNETANGIFQRSNGAWINLSAGLPINGDVKNGIQAADHGGWYLLDGRDLTTLSTSAQAAATALGLSGNLPNAANRFLKSAGAEAILATGGLNQVVLTQANLPTYNISGATLSNGNHSHSGTAASAGQHTHFGRAPTHSANGAESQGWPNGNNHQSFRTTDRQGQINVNQAAITGAGNHVHSLNIQANGIHNHSFNFAAGGNNIPHENQPAYLVVNTFIYLGE